MKGKTSSADSAPKSSGKGGLSSPVDYGMKTKSAPGSKITMKSPRGMGSKR